MSSLVSQRLQSSQNYPFCIGSSSCWSYHILGDCIHKEVIPYKEPFWRIIVHSGRNQGEDELSGLSHVPCLPAEIISLLRAEMVHRHSMRVGVELMNRSYFPGVLGSWGISIIPLLISAQCSAVLPLSWVHGGRACSPSPHPPPGQSQSTGSSFSVHGSSLPHTVSWNSQSKSYPSIPNYSMSFGGQVSEKHASDSRPSPSNILGQPREGAMAPASGFSVLGKKSSCVSPSGRKLSHFFF